MSSHGQSPGALRRGNEDLIKRLFNKVYSAIIGEKIFCPPETAVCLAAYACQAKFGSAKSLRDPIPPVQELLPKSTLENHELTTTEWETRISNWHLKLRHVPLQDAIVEYLDIAQDVELYGASIFEVGTSMQTRKWISLDAVGLNIYESKKRPPITRYLWSEISAFIAKGEKIEIMLAHEPKQTIEFFVGHSSTGDLLMNLFQGSKELYGRRKKSANTVSYLRRSESNSSMRMKPRTFTKAELFELDQKLTELELELPRRATDYEYAPWQVKDQLRQARAIEHKLSLNTPSTSETRELQRRVADIRVFLEQDFFTEENAEQHRFHRYRGNFAIRVGGAYSVQMEGYSSDIDTGKGVWASTHQPLKSNKEENGLSPTKPLIKPQLGGDVTDLHHRRHIIKLKEQNELPTTIYKENDNSGIILIKSLEHGSRRNSKQLSGASPDGQNSRRNSKQLPDGSLDVQSSRRGSKQLSEASLDSRDSRRSSKQLTDESLDTPNSRSNSKQIPEDSNHSKKVSKQFPEDSTKYRSSKHFAEKIDNTMDNTFEKPSEHFDTTYISDSDPMVSDFVEINPKPYPTRPNAEVFTMPPIPKSLSNDDQIFTTDTEFAGVEERGLGYPTNITAKMAMPVFASPVVEPGKDARSSKKRDVKVMNSYASSPNVSEDLPPSAWKSMLKTPSQDDQYISTKNRIHGQIIEPEAAVSPYRPAVQPKPKVPSRTLVSPITVSPDPSLYMGSSMDGRRNDVKFSSLKVIQPGHTKKRVDLFEGL